MRNQHISESKEGFEASDSMTNSFSFCFLGIGKFIFIFTLIFPSHSRLILNCFDVSTCLCRPITWSMVEFDIIMEGVHVRNYTGDGKSIYLGFLMETGRGDYFSTNEITFDTSTGKYNQVTPKWDHIIVSGSEVTQSDRCLDGKNSRRFRVRWRRGGPSL